jgi:hypothetical protein
MVGARHNQLTIVPFGICCLQLERWSKDESSSKKPRRQARGKQQQQQQSYQYSLQLLVPPGQLELGRRLIFVMYSSSPDLSDLDAPQLMQLLALAECYGVGKVVAAAAAHLHHMSVESMPLDVAAAVYALPDACLALAAVQQVQQAAADRLQQELGDLEVVWVNKEKQQQLLALPFGALLQLLGNKRTRVASEDTAVYTALRWLKHTQTPDNKQQQAHQQQQLAAVLRLPHCTPTFLASLAGQPKDVCVDLDSAWVCDCSPRLLADLLARATRSSEEQNRWLDTEYEDKASWRLPSRPASVVKRLELSWDLPLRELEERWGAAQGEWIVLGSSSHARTWQGREWWLKCEVPPSREEANVFLVLGGAPAYVSASIAHRCRSSWDRDDRDSPFVTLDGHYLNHQINHGWGGTIAKWGPDRKEWPQVKAWLQREGLVNSKGCLQLRCSVKSVA